MFSLFLLPLPILPNFCFVLCCSFLQCCPFSLLPCRFRQQLLFCFLHITVIFERHLGMTPRLVAIFCKAFRCCRARAPFPASLEPIVRLSSPWPPGWTVSSPHPTSSFCPPPGFNILNSGYFWSPEPWRRPQISLPVTVCTSNFIILYFFTLEKGARIFKST